MNIQEAIAKILETRADAPRYNLTRLEAQQVMEQIMSGQAGAAQIGAYLVALRMKGETIDEIAGSAHVMREKALAVTAPGIVVDTCGTGGDATGTFNISTTAAFVVAAQEGVTVAKHGNRSISSKSGSADVLRALGVCIDAELPVVQRCLDEVGLGFLFAPRHHSAMRHVAGARQELAVRTLFNLLGPLTNPARAPFQLVGVYDAERVESMAHVLGRLGSQQAMVVHGSDGLDEITTTGPTRAAIFRAAPNAATQATPGHTEGHVTPCTLEPEQFGLPRATLADLRGGDAAFNATLTQRILSGEKGPQRDIVLLNAGAALSVTPLCIPDRAKDDTPLERIRIGMAMAAEAIDSGRAMHGLERLIAVSNQTTTPPASGTTPS